MGSDSHLLSDAVSELRRAKALLDSAEDGTLQDRNARYAAACASGHGDSYLAGYLGSAIRAALRDLEKATRGTA